MNFQVEAYRVNADQVCIDISEKPQGDWQFTYVGPPPHTLEEKEEIVGQALDALYKHNGHEMIRQERRGIRASISSAVWNLPKKAPEPEAAPVKVVRDTETGEFAKKDRAKKDPKGTVTETVKKKK